MWQEIFRTLIKNTLRWKTIWLLFMWQEMFQTLIKIHSDEKPFGCYSCDKKFSELSSQNTLRWKTIWLSFMWQEIFRFLIKNTLRWKTIWLLVMWQKKFWTLISEYTQMENHLAANHVTKKFLNSHLRIHSDEKPFGCHSCDKKFSGLS